MKKSKKHASVRSWQAFILYAVIMLSTFVWSTFRVAAPYEVFAYAFTAGFGAYLGKRLMQKGDWFKNGENPEGKEDLIYAEK